jgi:phosphoserine phosphatase
VGDGANDLGMMEIAGLSIAFNAKPIVVQAADVAITDGDLLGVLTFMGIHLKESNSTLL